MEPLKVNANIVNGIYSSVEVFLTILFVCLLRILLSCHNLRTIYDTREPLQLNTAIISVFVDPGLGPPRIITFLVLLGALFTALTTAGGFSFSGATAPQYESAQVRNKVVPAAAGQYIDFRDHISSDATLISGTFLLLQSTACVEQEVGRVTFYALTNDIRDLHRIQWRIDELISNSTCLRRQNGFAEERLAEYSLPTRSFSLASCELRFDQVGVQNLSQVRRNDIIQIPFSEENDLGANCSFRIVELWCSTYSTFVCVGSVRMMDETGGFGQIIYRASRDRSLIPSLTSYRGKRRDDTEVLKSMAFLSDSITNSHSVLVRMMASSMIETNATVQRVVGERSVTNVNFVLLFWTFGTAFGLFALLGLVTSMIWLRVVWRKGRKGYNCFCSEGDALACAMQQLYWARKGRAGEQKGVAVGAVDKVVVTAIGDE
eukprot:TRINITY_DN1572_c0_g1_i1.p1 TRINITY_DN1572_c0_g1~~TRINITY_DN1572_c0_g1_i1.p1  ORF type:complete len:432 (+),score=56.61 TRINITY_DN1572_c0_g1_i1:481-1776(+)